MVARGIRLDRLPGRRTTLAAFGLLLLSAATVQGQPLSGCCGLRVEVRNAEGQPLAAAGVDVSGPGRAVSDHTDSTGGAHLRLPRPGTYRVSASKEGYLGISRGIEITLGEEVTVEFTLSPHFAPTPAITVTADRDPAAGTASDTASGPDVKAAPDRPATVREALPLIPGVVRTVVGLANPNQKPIESREYFVSQILRNPADRAGMREIVESRRVMYESAPNGDAYWVIDSDPGRWPDSPSSEFVRILAENRKLMNRYVQDGPNKELIYWVWDGWGTRSILENQMDVIRALQANTAGKFSLLGCRIDALRQIRELGLEDRTVWFPYDAVEYEPASPYTDLRFDKVLRSFAAVRGYSRLRGVMANAQTPDVQLPNLWLFHRKAWDADYSVQDTPAILRDAALDTFPALAADLARAWELMAADDSAAAAAMAGKLETAIREKRLGPPGTLGRFAFPDPALVVRNLVDQLHVHALAVSFIGSARSSDDRAAMQQAAERYFQAARRMVDLTGYSVQFNKKGGNQKPFFPWFYPTEEYNRMHAAWLEYRALHPGDAEAIYLAMKRRYSQTSGYDLNGEMIEFLVGTPPPRIPGVDYRN